MWVDVINIRLFIVLSIMPTHYEPTLFQLLSVVHIANIHLNNASCIFQFCHYVECRSVNSKATQS